MVVHAEGPSSAIDELVAFLHEGPPGARVGHVSVDEVPIEGHEQFAVRGVSAGVFVVQEHAATARHFDLRLEVGGVMRSWALPKGPSMDPAVKRLAVQVPDHGIAHNDFEGQTDDGGVVLWDRGSYEQGGRVPWPDALDRGHGVFVLRGEKLRGGFALQRTRPGERAQWLLIGGRARPWRQRRRPRPAAVSAQRGDAGGVAGREPAPLDLIDGSRRTQAERVWGLALTRGRCGISAPSRIARGTLVVSHSANGPRPARSSSPSMVGGRSS